jgi:hypothetical protein
MGDFLDLMVENAYIEMCKDNRLLATQLTLTEVTTHLMMNDRDIGRSSFDSVLKAVTRLRQRMVGRAV